MKLKFLDPFAMISRISALRVTINFHILRIMFPKEREPNDSMNYMIFRCAGKSGFEILTIPVGENMTVFYKI